MSFQITTAFVQQYGETVSMLAQQKMSRLRGAVTVETGVVGKTKYMDQVGATAMQLITNRHGDTPLIEVPHARRKVDLADYETADLIDDMDKLKTLIDPTNPYTMSQAMAAGRKIDDIIIAAALGTAYTGETGSTSVTSGFGVVAVNSWAYGTGSGNTGLTISKLIEAKQNLDAAEVDSDDRFLVLGSKQVSNLLATTEATSADFNTVRALNAGELDTFLGFKFIRSERLAVDANSYRRVLAFHKSGIGLCIGKDVSVSIDKRADKRNSQQVYTTFSMGASRLEEVKVVEIKCAE